MDVFKKFIKTKHLGFPRCFVILAFGQFAIAFFYNDAIRNRNKVFRSLDSEEAPDLPAPDHRESGKELENIELGREIQNAVQSLSQEQREVFLLRQQELSFKEIAEIQKCSLNTVLSRMHYAIKNLRVFLANSRSLIK